MSRLVKALIWDPQCGVNPLREEEIDSNLETLQALVHGLIEAIYPGTTIPELEGVHGYVNEEFVYKNPEWRERPWAMGPYEFLCGPAVFLGSGSAGTEAGCPVGRDVLAKHIRLSEETMMHFVMDRAQHALGLSVPEKVEVAPEPG